MVTKASKDNHMEEETRVSSSTDRWIETGRQEQHSTEGFADDGDSQAAEKDSISSSAIKQLIYFQRTSLPEEESVVGDQAVGETSHVPKISISQVLKPPILIEYSVSLGAWLEKTHSSGRLFHHQLLPHAKEQWLQESGLSFPELIFRPQPHWPDHKYKILLHGTPVLVGQLPPNSIFVEADSEKLAYLDIPHQSTVHPIKHLQATWCHQRYQPMLQSKNITCHSPGQFILLTLTSIVREYAHEFLGIQDVKEMLSELGKKWPVLVETCLEMISLAKLRRVLRLLVEDNFSLTHIPQILEILVDLADQELSAEEMADAVRQGLKRHLCHQHANHDTILAYLLDESLESVLFPYLIGSAYTRTLTLRQELPGFIQAFLFDLQRHLRQVAPSAPVLPVILTSAQLRRPLQKLIRDEFPTMAVLSYEEIDSQFHVVPLVTISVDRPTPSSGVPLHSNNKKW